MIYADNAATTPLSAAAAAAMEPYQSQAFGNPSTLYSLAREPRRAVKQARERIAAAINADPDEIYFTSGGTEADNWALKGCMFTQPRGRKLITSEIEHHAVLNSAAFLEQIGCRTALLPVDGDGRVAPEALKSCIDADTALVSVMLANNEIGTIEPVGELAELAHARGAIFHTDAVQAVGHIPVDVRALNVDMLSASAHKFGGPKGVGFLYIKRGINVLPLLSGGGQERGMRAGTENVAGIVGMAAALNERAQSLSVDAAYLNSLSLRLLERLQRHKLDFIQNGAANRIPGSLSLSFRDANGETLLHRLDLMGTAVATGSACDSKQDVLSHVIRAIKAPPEYATGTIRITLGTDNTPEQMDIIADQTAKILLK